jgi:hypothetical protein
MPCLLPTEPFPGKTSVFFFLENHTYSLFVLVKKKTKNIENKKHKTKKKFKQKNQTKK